MDVLVPFNDLIVLIISETKNNVVAIDLPCGLVKYASSMHRRGRIDINLNARAKARQVSMQLASQVQMNTNNFRENSTVEFSLNQCFKKVLSRKNGEKSYCRN